jgi:hypothetical protein
MRNMLAINWGTPVPDKQDSLQYADKAIPKRMVGNSTKAYAGFEDRAARALKLRTPGSRFLYHSNI